MEIIFSDEPRLAALTESVGSVRRRPRERYDEEILVRTIKHPPAVVVWSPFFATVTMDQMQ